MRAGARYAVIIGDDEVALGKRVTLKTASRRRASSETLAPPANAHYEQMR